MLIKQWMQYGMTLLLALGLVACGGSLDNSNSEKGEVVIGITDADGDFLAYAVDVTSIKLQRADGSKVEALPLSTRIDFSQYVELTELLTAATIPAGSYVAASMSLDYSSAQIQVEKNGVALDAAVRDRDGNPLTTLEVKVSLAGQNSLTIAPGVPAYLTLDFDLETSNSVDTSGTLPVVTVEPVLLADVALEAPKQHRLRGLLADVDTVNSHFELAMRPFILRQGAFGDLNAYVDDDTAYEINGAAYSGSAGLSQLNQLARNSWVIVYGSLNVAQHRFEADEVYAGSSVPGSSQDSVTGVVLSRSGDQLRLDAGSIVTRDGVLIFNQAIDVTLGATTKVTRQLSQAPFGSNDISVGQRVTLLGELSDDNRAMTSTRLARMLLNQIGGEVVTVTDGELVLDLQLINGRRVADFDFSGSGANGDHYRIDTGSLSLASIDVGDPLRVRGFVTPFGTVASDFEATSVMGLADVAGVMLVNWPGGDTSPFSSSAASGLVLDLNGSLLHHVSRQWLVTDLSGLAQATTIVANENGKGLFAMNVSGTVYVYGDFAAFESALSERIGGGLPLKRITAQGRFDDDTSIMTANAVSVVFARLLN